jgi:hypothetical protein
MTTQDLIDKRVVPVDGRWWSPFAQILNVAFRSPYEYPYSVLAWYKAVVNGCDPCFAFFSTMPFNLRGNFAPGYLYGLAGHSVISGLTEEVFVRAITREVIIKEEISLEPWVSVRSYNGGTTIFSTPTGNVVSLTTHGLMKSMLFRMFLRKKLGTVQGSAKNEEFFINGAYNRWDLTYSTLCRNDFIEMLKYEQSLYEACAYDFSVKNWLELDKTASREEPGIEDEEKPKVNLLHTRWLRKAELIEETAKTYRYLIALGHTEVTRIPPKSETKRQWSDYYNHFYQQYPSSFKVDKDVYGFEREPYGYFYTYAQVF